MPWPEEKKQLTRQKIVDTATKLFMQRGYENVSIEEIMAEAKLTRGGFYNHFSGKPALYHCAILSCIEQGRAFFAQSDRGNLHDFIHYYLSTKHYFANTVCPLSSITADIVRRDDVIRTAYDQSFKIFVAGIKEKSRNEENSDGISQRQALQVATLLIGGMTLARAIKDEESVKEILDASVQNALAVLNRKE